MQWLSSHPYVVALSAAGILIALGALIVTGRTTVQPQNADTAVWSGSGSLLDPTVGVPRSAGVPQENIYAQVQSGPPFHYEQSAVSIPAQNYQTGGEFDFDAFISMLSQPNSTPSGGTVSDDSLGAYSFIPGGLVSTTTSQRRRTTTQQAIYSYGNEVGGTIQSFESSYKNASQTLKNQFEDREDPAKGEAVIMVAQGLSRVGRTLEAMEYVPKELESAHAKVAASYQEMGEKLAKMPSARGDQEFLKLALEYNTAVEAFVQNYVALATLISAYSVTFTQDDPGSVFTFTNASL